MQLLSYFSFSLNSSFSLYIITLSLTLSLFHLIHSFNSLLWLFFSPSLSLSLISSYRMELLNSSSVYSICHVTALYLEMTGNFAFSQHGKKWSGKNWRVMQVALEALCLHLLKIFFFALVLCCQFKPFCLRLYITCSFFSIKNFCDRNKTRQFFSGRLFWGTFWGSWDWTIALLQL